MSNAAAAGYIATLRAAKGVDQADVARTVKTALRNITAWETGKRLPHVPTLARLLAYLGGSADDLHHLLLDKQATYADGKEAAERWIRLRTAPEDYRRIMDVLGGDRRSAADRLRRYADDLEGQ